MPKTPMTSRSRIWAASVALFLSGAVGATLFAPAAAQPGLPSTAVKEYAVRFVCGDSAAIDQAPNLSVGTYSTSVVVHNPGEPVTFRRKVAVARQPTLGPGGPPAPPAVPSRFERMMLGRDQAVEFTCQDISFQAKSQPLTGFLVIHAPQELDVVAIVTASGVGRVATFHSERVPVRVVRIPFVPPDENSPRN